MNKKQILSVLGVLPGDLVSLFHRNGNIFVGASGKNAEIFYRLCSGEFSNPLVVSRGNLISALKNVDEPFTVSIHNKSVYINGNKRKFIIASENAQAFIPDFPKSKEFLFEIDSKLLYKIIRPITSFANKKDDVFCYIKLEFRENNITSIALSEQMLAYYVFEGNPTGYQDDLYIHVSNAEVLVRVFENDEGLVKFYKVGKQNHIVFDNLTITSRIQDILYPEWRSFLLPTDPEAYVSFYKKDLKNLENVNTDVMFDVSEGLIKLSDDTVKEVIEKKGEGVIKIPSYLLLRILKAFSSDIIALSFSGNRCGVKGNSPDDPSVVIINLQNS